jgi:hypothetical protein
MKTAVKDTGNIIIRDEFAKKFIGAYGEAVKIMQGELPRPKTNWNEQFKEWDELVEEVKNGLKAFRKILLTA